MTVAAVACLTSMSLPLVLVVAMDVGDDAVVVSADSRDLHLHPCHTLDCLSLLLLSLSAYGFYDSHSPIRRDKEKESTSIQYLMQERVCVCAKKEAQAIYTCYCCRGKKRAAK